MSRVGRLPIPVPKDVVVKIENGEVIVKGPKGELRRILGIDISVSMEKDELIVARANDNRDIRALHGLTRALVANMITGVTKGFEKGIEIVGVGYRAQKAGDKIMLNVGYSHPVEVVPMPGVALTVEGTTKVKITGIDKEVVGLMAAKIKAIKPHDAYKGKGLRYAGEQVRLKPGKAGKAIGK
ncbi:MAG: 50S ribosomal protein L6 [Chloroflexi bacterium]|nr:50S ribosomal protein L6 [Chloroflexota bacterium]